MQINEFQLAQAKIRKNYKDFLDETFKLPKIIIKENKKIIQEDDMVIMDEDVYKSKGQFSHNQYYNKFLKFNKKIRDINYEDVRLKKQLKVDQLQRKEQCQFMNKKVNKKVLQIKNNKNYFPPIFQQQITSFSYNYHIDNNYTNDYVNMIEKKYIFPNKFTEQNSEYSTPSHKKSGIPLNLILPAIY
jgi:hypothetical protein